MCQSGYLWLWRCRVAWCGTRFVCKSFLCNTGNRSTLDCSKCIRQSSCNWIYLQQSGNLATEAQLKQLFCGLHWPVKRRDKSAVNGSMKQSSQWNGFCKHCESLQSWETLEHTVRNVHKNIRMIHTQTHTQMNKHTHDLNFWGHWPWLTFISGRQNED